MTTIDRALAEQKLELEDDPENPDQKDANEILINNFINEAMDFRVKWLLKIGLVRLSKYGIRDLFDYQ